MSIEEDQRAPRHLSVGSWTRRAPRIVFVSTQGPYTRLHSPSLHARYLFALRTLGISCTDVFYCADPTVRQDNQSAAPDPPTAPEALGAVVNTLGANVNLAARLAGGQYDYIFLHDFEPIPSVLSYLRTRPDTKVVLIKMGLAAKHREIQGPLEAELTEYAVGLERLAIQAATHIVSVDAEVERLLGTIEWDKELNIRTIPAPSTWSATTRPPEDDLPVQQKNWLCLVNTDRMSSLSQLQIACDALHQSGVLTSHNLLIASPSNVRVDTSSWESHQAINRIEIRSEEHLHSLFANASILLTTRQMTSDPPAISDAIQLDLPIVQFTPTKLAAAAISGNTDDDDHGGYVYEATAEDLAAQPLVVMRRAREAIRAFLREGGRQQVDATRTAAQLAHFLTVELGQINHAPEDATNLGPIRRTP